MTQSAALPPLLDTLTARLEEAGNERSDAELVAVGYAHAWRSDKKLPERSRALARESVYDWEKRTRSSAGTSRVLTEAESRLLREKAEHRVALAEGLLDVLRDRDEAVRGRGAEHARKFLRVEETDVSALRSLLDEQVRIERLILSAVPKLEEAVSAGGGGGSPGAGLTGRGHGGRDPVAKALAATGQSRGGHPLGGAPGEAGPNQAFEQLHPRGRGGEWIQKGEGYGKQGPSPRVQQLQARLRELGFQVNSDGQFGVHTEEAVKAFQRKYGLQETGKVDASTVEALRNPPPETARQARGQVATAAGGGKKKGAATSGSRSSRSGQRGSSGSRSSGTSASTGTGAGTSAITLRPGDSKGIEQFQRSHGLKVDGKMGPETKAALEAVNRDRASRGGGTSRSSATRGGATASASGGSGSGAGLGGSGMVRRGDGMSGKPDAGTQAIQQALDALGYELGDGGVDGRFGGDTQKAIETFQRRYGLRVDGVAGPQTKAALRRALRRQQQGEPGNLSADQLTTPSGRSGSARSRRLQHSAPTEETEEDDMDRIDESVYAEVKHPRDRSGRWKSLTFTMKGDHGRADQKLTGTDLGNGLALVRRNNDVVAIPEWQVYHHETGVQVAAIGDRGELEDHMADSMAVHFRGDYKGKSLEELRKHDKLRKQAKEVWRVRKAHDDNRTQEASFQDGQQVPYGGVTPFMTRSGDKAMGGVPAQFGPRGHADPKHRTPGMDAFFGEEPPQMPPNLRESDGTSFEMCGTCVHHNGKRLCALYSAGTDRDDICDSWYSLTPPEQRNRALAYVTSANDVDEAKRDGTGSQVTTALRHQQHAFALLEAAVEQTGGDELDKLAQKFIRRGMPPEAAKKAAKKALARKRVAEARAGVEGFGLVEVEESGHKIKCPKCGHVMSATLSKCPNCGHDMTEARKAKFAKLDEAAQRDLLLDEPEAADALAGWRLDEATLTAEKRKKLSKSDYAIPESESYPIHDESHARNALARVSQHGSPAEKKRVRAAVKRRYPHVVKEAAELVEVKSSAYPGLERKPGKQNWVDYAGGLPSYIERIAKHIHYEHGHPIGQAIAFAVGTVRRWCAGGSVSKGGASKSNVTAATKAKACAALAEWEAKKKKGSAAMHAREAATDSDFDLGALAVSLALSEVEALDIEVPELTQEQALQFLSEVELHEASYAHAIHFDPRLHPRNRTGEFREILERLAKVGGGTEVTMPNGVAVRRRRGMSGFVVSRGGKKIATGNPAKIAQQALDATGIPEPGRERHMGVQSPRFAAAFEEGTGPKKGSADEVIRSVLSNQGDVVGKNVRAQRSGTSASIFSYDEPVAHVDHARREVMLNTHKYSPTTSGHRELVRKAAVEHGYGVRSIDRTEALSRAGMEARPFEKSASKRAMQPAARAASYRDSERRNLEVAAELHAQGNHEHARDYEEAARRAGDSAAVLEQGRQVVAGVELTPGQTVEREAQHRRDVRRVAGDVKGDPGTATAERPATRRGMTVTVGDRPQGDGEFQKGDRVVLADGREGTISHKTGGGISMFGGRHDTKLEPEYAVSTTQPAGWTPSYPNQPSYKQETVKHSRLSYHPDELASRREKIDTLRTRAEKGTSSKKAIPTVDRPVTNTGSAVPDEFKVAHGYGEYVNPAHRNPSEGLRVRVMPTHPEHGGKVGHVHQSRAPQISPGVVRGGAVGPGTQVQPMVWLDGEPEPVPIKSSYLMLEDQQPFVRMKPSTNTEHMLFHYLAGKKPPANFAPNSIAGQQWSYKGKGGKKAEREALARKLTGIRLNEVALVLGWTPFGQHPTVERMSLIEAEEITAVRLPVAELIVAVREQGGNVLAEAVADVLRGRLAALTPDIDRRLEEAVRGGDARLRRMYETIQQALAE